MRSPRQRTPQRVVWLALFAFGFPATAANGPVPPAQIGVSPARIELEVGSQPTTESLSVVNFGDAPVEVQASVLHWDLDERNEVRTIAPTEQSLDQWIVINPLRFTVPAGGSQTVRFSVRPRVAPEPGEHRAMIYFTQQLEPDGERQIRVRFRVGVAVYGQVGEVRRNGTLHAVKVIDGTNPPEARFDLSSDGSANVRMLGRYAVWRAEDYPGVQPALPTDELPVGALLGGALPSRPVLPGTRREIILQTTGSLEPGRYVLDLRGTLGESPVDRAVPFTVAHPMRASGWGEP